MSRLNIIIWTLIEGVKYLTVSHGVLGFHPQKSKRKFLILVYILLGIVLGPMQKDCFWYFASFPFVVFLLFFDEKMIHRVEGTILSIMVIDALDLLIWSILINVIPAVQRIPYSTYISDVAGILCWLAVAFLLREQRKQIRAYFVELSFPWFLLIILICTGFGLVAGGVHFSLSGAIPVKSQKMVLVVFMLTTVLMMFAGGALLYNIASKKNLEHIHEMQKDYFRLQQKYYEEKLQSNEQLQKFRHDIKKHMRTIHMLCENRQFKELQDYVKEYVEMYPEQYAVSYTGNMVVDYFIEEMISDFRQYPDFTYQIVGQFPKEMEIENLDLCTLAANALENASNAMKKVTGSISFQMEVKNYDGHVIIDMRNSCDAAAVEINRKKADGHGYGLMNMRDVVAQYHGSLETKVEQGMFYLHIFI